MSKIMWDQDGERLYETGTKNGVLFPKTGDNGTYADGVAWNGLTAVSESPSGAEATALYADDIKYLNLISNEEFGCTIEAYTYPDEFAVCDGSVNLGGIILAQQPRKKFGFSYRTTVGNDEEGNEYGHKLHLVYDCMAAPSEKSYATVNDSPEAITFSWEVTTTPVPVEGYKPTAHVVIDSTKIQNPNKLKLLEAIIYGADEFSTTKTYAVGDVVEHTTGEQTRLLVCTTAITTAGEFDENDWEDKGVAGPRLPLPDEVIAIMA